MFSRQSLLALYAAAATAFMPAASAQDLPVTQAGEVRRSGAEMPVQSCLLIIADSTTSFNGSVSAAPAYETARTDEWAATMMARAQVFTSPEFAGDMKYSYPFNVMYADFATEVHPRTGWVRISNEKDLASFGSMLAALPRVVRAGTYSAKALAWAVNEVKRCPNSHEDATLYRINIETDGTATDTRKDEYLKDGVYLDPNLIALTQMAFQNRITINSLGIGYTTGSRPGMDNLIDLRQVVCDNFRTPDGKCFVARTTPEFVQQYRLKLNNDVAMAPELRQQRGGGTRFADIDPGTPAIPQRLAGMVSAMRTRFVGHLAHGS